MATTGGRNIVTARGATGTGKDVSNREDLANFISMITRDETPFLSSIGKSKATNIYHEWQTDELTAPGNSRVAEGADFLAAGTTPAAGDGAASTTVGPMRTRLGNYTQINSKVISVSGSRRAIDQAGVADEYAYQLKKRGTEMRRDMEFDLVNTYNKQTTSGARQTGGYQSFVNSGDTCVFKGAFTAPTTPNAGTDVITVAAGAATAALALTDIDSVMQKIYENGGSATRIMVSPKLRRDFSDLMVNDTGVRRNIDEDGKLRQSVDVYMSDFGDLMVVPNYIMGLAHTTTDATTTQFDAADSAALIYDPQWFAMATLRPMQEVEVGQKGDSTVGMFVEEWSLEVKNPKGCGAVYGLA